MTERTRICHGEVGKNGGVRLFWVDPETGHRWQLGDGAPVWLAERIARNDGSWATEEYHPLWADPPKE